MADPRKHVTKAVAEIDQAELAVRLIEIGCKMKRPMGTRGSEAWQAITDAATRGEVLQYIVDDFDEMARASILYFGECAANTQRIS